MAEIPLRNKAGECTGYAIVDDCLYEELNQYKWYKDKKGMAQRGDNKLGTTIKMHRVVANVPKGKCVRFLNGDKLDCRLDNLIVGNLAHLMDDSIFGDPSECWSWPGVVSPMTGYGHFDGTTAHRAIYERLIGEVPKGMHLDHRCHTDDQDCLGGITCLHRRCVNPSHLEIVTPKENVRRSNGGGEKTHCVRGHKLSPENVKIILLRGKSEARACLLCQKIRNQDYNIVKRERRRKLREEALSG